MRSHGSAAPYGAWLKPLAGPVIRVLRQWALIFSHPSSPVQAAPIATAPLGKGGNGGGKWKQAYAPRDNGLPASTAGHP